MFVETEVRETGVYGRALFAAQPIRRGTIVCSFTLGSDVTTEDQYVRAVAENRQPVTRTGSLSSSRSPLSRANTLGSATSAIMAHYLLVTYITPLVPGDEDYAFCAMIPANAEGLRIYPRRPYSTMATSTARGQVMH